MCMYFNKIVLKMVTNGSSSMLTHSDNSDSSASSCSNNSGDYL